MEQDDFSDLESFRVHPIEESTPPTIKDTVAEPSRDPTSDLSFNLNASESSHSLWDRLTSFLRPDTKKSSAAIASLDPTPGPVMNKKAI